MIDRLIKEKGAMNERAKRAENYYYPYKWKNDTLEKEIVELKKKIE